MEVYIDDMLVKSLEAEDHISHLEQAFSTLRKYNMKLNSAKCSFGVSSGKFLGYIVTHRGIEANLDQIRAIHSIPSPRNVKEVQKLTGRMAALSRFISRLSDKSHAFFETLKKPKDFEWTEKCESALEELKTYLTTPPLLSKTLHGEVLLLYLSVSEHAVRAVLVREEGSKQLPIYYVLADFVAKLSQDLLPALEQEVRLQKEADEEGEWVLHVDGSSNIRGVGVGIVLTSLTGNTASRAIRCNFKATNNESEYEALIAGLSLAHLLGAENIQVYSDSQLIINQVQGEYQSKDDRMIQYLAVAQRLISKFKSCKLTQIPREQNSQTDALANLGSALQMQTQMSISVLVLQWPATLERAKRRVLCHRGRRNLDDPHSSGVLYHRSFVGPYLRCVTPREAAIILVERHEGDCGSHSSGRSLVLRAKRATYYWPTMAKEANKKARLCDRCQRHAPIPRLPPENLKSISSPWPFRKWDMDIVGKFPTAPGQKVFILIVTDYFSKWVKAEVLSRITNLQIRKFIWAHVITWFEVPEEIVTDNGPSSQSNGQAESTNKTMVNMLKKRLEGSQGNWAEELHGVLWAYRTTPKTATQETPNALVYGAEAIIPTEMHVKTTISGTTSQEENHELMSLSLDLLDEKREAARLRNRAYQQEVAKT
ncbi:uncharacterized protein LOC106378704 [Brassica napus]|uniref:uncharacterized protein LOC106378704 n=1 Tax=Brassica napus TaxID=3708 RepID=UPI0006AA78A2|nr:uncharacterized protein LOC106378704 [Brassica napus]